MAALDQVHILTGEEGREASGSHSRPLVVVGTGCKSGDIIGKTMALGLTVPLGSRPGVGAGLWLQGGIGHLARLHGLACDAIIGAAIVSVASSQTLYIGCVPSEHRPAGAVRPENDIDLLWAMKGAGTKFGVVISIVFKVYATPVYLVRKGVVPLDDETEARLRLSDFDKVVARNLPRQNLLAYAFPLPKLVVKQKLIILVTGESCAGKDYCAETWASVFTTCNRRGTRARAASISEAIKREYAAATGANLKLGVLLITGMRDEAPVATFFHLVPPSRLLEVEIKAGKGTRWARQGAQGSDDDVGDAVDIMNGRDGKDHPDLIFSNDRTGNEAAKRFWERHLLLFLHEDLERLADM
ncbi:hypothetical protein LTR86_011298, partial [Recurvomyces mirabilis]